MFGRKKCRRCGTFITNEQSEKRYEIDGWQYWELCESCGKVLKPIIGGTIIE